MARWHRAYGTVRRRRARARCDVGGRGRLAFGYYRPPLAGYWPRVVRVPSGLPMDGCTHKNCANCIYFRDGLEGARPRCDQEIGVTATPRRAT